MTLLYFEISSSKFLFIWMKTCSLGCISFSCEIFSQFWHKLKLSHSEQINLFPEKSLLRQLQQIMSLWFIFFKFSSCLLYSSFIFSKVFLLSSNFIKFNSLIMSFMVEPQYFFKFSSKSSLSVFLCHLGSEFTSSIYNLYLPFSIPWLLNFLIKKL